MQRQAFQMRESAVITRVLTVSNVFHIKHALAISLDYVSCLVSRPAVLLGSNSFARFIDGLGHYPKYYTDPFLQT